MLLEKIQEDVKAAMKERDSFRVETLRYVLAQLKNASIEARGELPEEKVLSILQKEKKKRIESIEAYEKAGRKDLADKERAEIGLIDGYLPEELSDDELAGLVDGIISELQPAGLKDMGRVMGAATAKAAGRADGARISALVRERLSGL